MKKPYSFYLKAFVAIPNYSTDPVLVEIKLRLWVVILWMESKTIHKDDQDLRGYYKPEIDTFEQWLEEADIEINSDYF